MNSKGKTIGIGSLTLNRPVTYASDRRTKLHASPFERLADCWVVGSGNILTSV
jgi:hypothetical protein